MLKEIETTIERGNFGIAPNTLINMPLLSLKAKGLYVYMNSKPDGWRFSARRIAGQNKDGRDGILSAIRELREAGYVDAEKQSDGRVTYTVHWKPKTDLPTESECEVSGKATVGKSVPISNKELISKKEEYIYNENSLSSKTTLELKHIQSLITAELKKKTTGAPAFTTYTNDKDKREFTQCPPTLKEFQAYYYKYAVKYWENEAVEVFPVDKAKCYAFSHSDWEYWNNTAKWMRGKGKTKTAVASVCGTIETKVRKEAKRLKDWERWNAANKNTGGESRVMRI